MRTIFGLTRVSTFCVELQNLVSVLDELLGAVKTEWAQDAILELVSAYGKGAIMPGDVTVGVITVLVERGVVEFSPAVALGEGFLGELRRVCEAHGFSFAATAA